MTLEQVAELSGVSISTLSKIEKGQALIRYYCKIASVDYSLAELFADELPAPLGGEHCH
ncbi:helix-turn-helix transcriptional regulator (plasmid) [Pseudomonas silvicola]|nr:helix-turn-helix transcriptional regulator [Pseudomonas silvicola]